MFNFYLSEKVGLELEEKNFELLEGISDYNLEGEHSHFLTDRF